MTLVARRAEAIFHAMSRSKATPATVSDDRLERITEVIVEQARPCRVVLFGSRARGDADEWSDYDVMVEIDRDDATASSKAIRDAFGEHHISADVIIRTPTQFAEKCDDVGTLDYWIAREGRVVHSTDRSEVGGRPFVRKVGEPRPGVPRSLDDWIARSERDFREFKNSLASVDPVWDAICFHAHQGVEKLLKGMLVATHVPPHRTHALEKLLDLCPSDLQTNAELRADCKLLVDLYPKSRYPEQPEPTQAEALEAVAAAHRIRAAIHPYDRGIAELGSLTLSWAHRGRRPYRSFKRRTNLSPDQMSSIAHTLTSTRPAASPMSRTRFLTEIRAPCQTPSSWPSDPEHAGGSDSFGEAGEAGFELLGPQS